MAEARNLLDLMPTEEREKALKRAKRRLSANKGKHSIDVYPEVFLVGKAGEFWGWEAMMAIRRGYVVNPDVDDEGKLFYTKSVLTLEEVLILQEASSKVRRSQDITNVHTGMIANSFSPSSKSFGDAIKPLEDRAEVKE